MKLLWILPFLLFSCATSQHTRGKRGIFNEWTSSSGRNDSATYCEPFDSNARQDLLSLADPSNFPRTRYRLGSWRAIEKETDCSRFVHEIYKRAGFPFHFRSSRELKYAAEFETVDADDALPGDLMVFRGHVGIVDQDRRIISATRNRGRNRSSITKMDPSNFKSPRGGIYALRYRCPAGFRPVAYNPPPARALSSVKTDRKKKRSRFNHRPNHRSNQRRIQIEASNR